MFDGKLLKIKKGICNYENINLINKNDFNLRDYF